jgi:hypothetical protein
MSIIRAALVRRYGVPLVAALVLAACGSAGSGSGSPPADTDGQAPYGIESVTWPTDQATIEKLVAGLPRSMGEWTTRGPEYAESPASVSVTYKDGSGDAHWPYVDVSRAGDGETALGSMLGMLMWAGGPQGCIDWRSSPSLASVPEATSGPDLRAPVDAASTSPTEFLWFECTSVVNVDGGPGTLPPDLQEYLLVWAAGDWMYTVDGRGADQRQALTELLVAGVSARA